MLQGKVSKWQDLGPRSCGLIRVGKEKIYTVNASEVQPDETGKRRLVVGEVVVFKQMPDRIEKGRVYRTAIKVIRPKDVFLEKQRAAGYTQKQRVKLFEAEQQKERAAERQRRIVEESWTAEGERSKALARRTMRSKGWHPIGKSKYPGWTRGVGDEREMLIYVQYRGEDSLAFSWGFDLAKKKLPIDFVTQIANDHGGLFREVLLAGYNSFSRVRIEREV
jgi:hypothetical protein